MTTKRNRTTESVPTWSLNYIVNADPTGLTDEEIAMVDQWVNDWQEEIVSPITDEEGNTYPYFSQYPLFGLSTEVEECDIIYNNNI